MGLQSWVQAHQGEQDWAVLQVDLRNAFNSLHREPILEEVGRLAPELVPWISTCYAHHSHLFAQGHRLTSQCGVQQGDPLGPLLFALAWHRVVRMLPPDLLMNVWYLDDGHLIGRIGELDSALQIIQAGGARIGITVNWAKCKLWGPALSDTNQLSVTSLNNIPQVPWAPNTGLRVLGLPVEHPSSITFRRQQLQGVVAQLGEACSLLGHLGDLQVQHLLLRYSLDACRVMHILRGIDCTALQSDLESGTACIRSCLGSAMGSCALSDLE